VHIRSLLSHRGLLAAAAAVAALPLAVAGAGAASATGASHPAFQPPPIKHVWVIELENEGFNQSFGDPSADPYLATTLPRMGALLTNYFAVGHDSLDNYIAQVTGQAPDPAT
jgi:phosphatidylinositol-3-phosphatase